MRHLLLLVAIVTSSMAYASSNPEVTRILGPTQACNLVQVYQIEVDDTDNLVVTIQGGTLSPVSLPQSSVCGGVSTTVNSTTSITYTGDDGNCAFTISVRATWNSSGTRRLTARANNGNNSDTRTLTFRGNNPTISSSVPNGGTLCLFGFGGQSEFFSSTGPNDATVSWSASSFGGPPLTISSPNSRSTSISGFIVGQFYTITVTYTCPGQTPRSASTSFQTADFDSGDCGFFQADGEPEVSPTDTGISGEEGNEPEGAGLSGQSVIPDHTIEAGLDPVGKSLVFPNPAPRGSEVTLRLTDGYLSVGQVADVNLYNASGQVVLSRKVNTANTQINLGELPAGYYALRVITDGRMETLPLIVNQRP